MQNFLDQPPSFGRCKRKGLHGENDILLDGHVAENGWFLSQIADPAPRPFKHRRLSYIATFKKYAATIGRLDSRNHGEGRGFARPARAHQANDFTAPDFDANVGHDDAGTERLAEILRRQHSIDPMQEVWELRTVGGIPRYLADTIVLSPVPNEDAMSLRIGRRRGGLLFS